MINYQVRQFGLFDKLFKNKKPVEEEPISKKGPEMDFNIEEEVNEEQEIQDIEDQINESEEPEIDQEL